MEEADDGDGVTKLVLHYQQCLEKYAKRNDEHKMLYCIGKLRKIPVTISHLEKTGVGRTVNSYRKWNDEVGNAAKELITIWREMVKNQAAKEEDESEENDEDNREEPVDTYNGLSKNAVDHERGVVEEQKKSSKDHRSREESSSKHKHKDHHTKHKESSDTSHNSSLSKSSFYEKKHSSHSSKNKYADRNKVSSSEEDVRNTPKKKDKLSSSSNSSKRDHNCSDDENLSHDSDIENNRHKKKHKPEPEPHKNGLHESSKHKHSSSNHVSGKEKKRDDSGRREKEKVNKTLKVDNKSSKKEKRNHSEKRQEEERKDKRDAKEKSKDKQDQKKSKDKERDKEKPKSKKRIAHNENGIDSFSGASFAEALGMMEPDIPKISKKKATTVIQPSVDEDSSTKATTSGYQNLVEKTDHDALHMKKLEPVDMDLSSLLPEITPNYRPLGSYLENSISQTRNKATADYEALSAVISSRNQRTKVYSGNKCAWSVVPTLFELCIRILQDNIDALEYTGGVPYTILKPVVERATRDQLYMLEQHNPYLIEETDELWQRHCQKDFRTKRREEMETWRDMYMRCIDEREEKLSALTKNIKLAQDKSLPVRTTKLAYVDSIAKPPRLVARQQAKNGTGPVVKKPAMTPSSRLTILATAGPAGQVVVPNPGSKTSGNGGGRESSRSVKPKKAPLMQKTLAAIKNTRYRR